MKLFVLLYVTAARLGTTTTAQMTAVAHVLLLLLLSESEARAIMARNKFVNVLEVTCLCYKANDKYLL